MKYAPSENISPLLVKEGDAKALSSFVAFQWERSTLQTAVAVSPLVNSVKWPRRTAEYTVCPYDSLHFKFVFSEKATKFEEIFVVLLTRASCSVHAIALLSKSRQRVFRNKCGQVVLYKLQIHLTASFFGSGPMPTPMKSQNTTIWGSGDPASAQWSQPSMFCYWCPLFADNRAVDSFLNPGVFIVIAKLQ